MKDQNSPIGKLSRRERQIMDVVLEKQHVTAQEIVSALDDAPSLSAVRTLLGRMVEKQALGYTQQGARYVYFVAGDQEKIQHSALNRLLKTFFKGSPSKAVNALLDMEPDTLTSRELAELERTIERLKKKTSDKDE